MTMHQRTIRELESLPNKIAVESSEERKARLAAQHIGSCDGTHPKVLAAQEVDSKIRRRIAARKEEKS